MLKQHDKRYFVNNINVSQSHISQEYSMRFDGSNPDIKLTNNVSGSHQKSNYAPPSQQTKNQVNTGLKLLHPELHYAISDKFFETKKFRTDDPDLLLEFYEFYKKSPPESIIKTIHQLQAKIQEQNYKDLPQSAKIQKLQNKLNFQKALLQDQNNVYYTFMHQKQKNEKQKQNKKLIEEKEKIFRQNKKPQRGMSAQVKNRLYGETNIKKLTPQQEKQENRMKFGQKLIQYWEKLDSFQQMTVDSLYSTWLKVPNKSTLKLEAQHGQVKGIIRDYMYHNFNKLVEAYYSKMRLRNYDPKTNSNTIRHFKINIPPQGFYVFYSQFIEKRDKIIEKINNQKQKEQNRRIQKEKQIKEKVLKRPVSSTPLSVLAQPKNGNIQQILELIKKYPHDKQLKRILAEKSIPVARRPQQYAVHSLQQQIKIKNRVKHQPNKNTDKIIQNILLNKTVKLQIQDQESTLIKLLLQDDLSDNKVWRKTKDLLNEAFKAQLFSKSYLVPSIHKFVQARRIDGMQNPSNLDNATLVNNVIDYFDKQGKRRQDELNSLRKLIQNVHYQNKQQSTEEQKKKTKIQRDQKRKFYSFMTQKAEQYIRQYILNKQSKEFRMQFMNELYSQALKQHKPYLNKNFPIFQHQEGKQNIYSPLLKYEFFKMVKDINPDTMEKDLHKKNATWTPAGKSDGFSTFNRMATAYYNPPSLGKPKQDTRNNVWEKSKIDQRSKFIMKMTDATECTFKPTFYKKA